ncbi:MAG TPA: hypothetical protein VHO50_07110 [Bacteroidales bacterium]|nr:hypothetical protein [Bacteroidales bacterium]
MINVKEIYIKAKEKGVCELFKGTETEDELINLFLTIKGIEFCTKNNFPSLDILRQLHGEKLEKHGIYIDSNVALHNEPMIVLAGNTIADLTYDNGSKGHRVILMHGAKAKITACGWAVVFVTNAGGEVKTDESEKAKIFL